MTTVGLLEPSYHQALIPPIATIAHEATGDVTVFTTEENYKHAMAAMDDDVAESCMWIVKDEDESFRPFFERVEQATVKLDVIWTITPYGPPEIAQELLTFSPCCPSVTLIHASSRFVPPNHRMFSNVFTFFVKLFSHHLPAPVRGRAWNQLGVYLNQHILDNYDCVLPLYPSITKYVEQVVESNALVDWFFYGFYQPDIAIDQKDLQITVPGRITDDVRNYDILFDVLDNLGNKRDCLTVRLLGRPVGASGEQIVDQCERYEQRGYDIQYYPSGEWVPAEEFTHQLARTDLIFAPINIHQGELRSHEKRIMGRTATSGAIADAVRIGRPLVMPEEFPVASEFEDLITTYEDSTDATTLIESWISSETTRQKLQQRAERTARQFTLEKQAQRFESLCRRTIEASNRSR